MERISDYIIEKRVVFLIIISLVSIFFIYRAAQIKVYTIFADLLPQQHEYIEVYNESDPEVLANYPLEDSGLYVIWLFGEDSGTMNISMSTL